jgi:hypothetical protein
MLEMEEARVEMGEEEKEDKEEKEGFNEWEEGSWIFILKRGRLV